MKTCYRSREYFKISLLFIFGFLCGQQCWNQIRPSVDLDFKTCHKAAASNTLNNIRKKIATTGIRSDPPAKNSSKQSYVVTNPDDSEDNFLFIGIMTARKFLENRAFASSQTWVPRVPGKVVYFLGEGEEYTGPLNVVQLKGVKENDYPPQKKSFAMVDYMSQHFAKDYKWLIRADDDVYMKVDELVKFLKSINDTSPRYIGQPGFGKAIEAGKLGLAGAFCMGGPGVIMTPKVVMGVAPGLKDCLGLTVTGHEDTELGRCITINTGVQCTTAYEMKELFYQNYAELDLPNSSFKKDLGKDEIRAVTLHPVKEAPFVFRVDNFFNNLTLNNIVEKKDLLIAEMGELEKLINGKNVNTAKRFLVDSSQTFEDNRRVDTTIFRGKIC
uniref:Hexosyltransferase n=1 Tax=Arion vulgaris TaxID=1028688 RepID=A0A0B6ZTU0_9EUPU